MKLFHCPPVNHQSGEFHLFPTLVDRVSEFNLVDEVKFPPSIISLLPVVHRPNFPKIPFCLDHVNRELVCYVTIAAATTMTSIASCRTTRSISHTSYESSIGSGFRHFGGTFTLTGCRTGNAEKLSSSRVEPGQGFKSAAA